MRRQLGDFAADKLNAGAALLVDAVIDGTRFPISRFSVLNRFNMVGR